MRFPRWLEKKDELVSISWDGDLYSLVSDAQEFEYIYRRAVFEDSEAIFYKKLYAFNQGMVYNKPQPQAVYTYASTGILNGSWIVGTREISTNVPSYQRRGITLGR